MTGILYSLLSHPNLRQNAFDIHLDATLERLAQVGCFIVLFLIRVVLSHDMVGNPYKNTRERGASDNILSFSFSSVIIVLPEIIQY